MLVFGQDLTIPELILSVIAAVIMSTVLKMLDNLALYGGGRPVRVMKNLGTDFPRLHRLHPGERSLVWVARVKHSLFTTTPH